METTEWILESLSISQDWNKKGHYRGNVKFKNGVTMEFSMLLDSAKCAKMISMLQEEIQESAAKLGDLMIKSMPIQLPPAQSENFDL